MGIEDESRKCGNMPERKRKGWREDCEGGERHSGWGVGGGGRRAIVARRERDQVLKLGER